jgi:hypothetical protein
VSWLHIRKLNMQHIGQEICNYLSDGVEGYLMLRHRIDGYDGQILMLGPRLHHDNPFPLACGLEPPSNEVPVECTVAGQLAETPLRRREL